MQLIVSDAKWKINGQKKEEGWTEIKRKNIFTEFKLDYLRWSGTVEDAWQASMAMQWPSVMSERIRK